jgi:glycosyltransferase involved in cell wall biosynthesis
MISVIMPCFNAEAYIAEAVECVLSQTYKTIQLIVVDDGSTDNTSHILQKYKKHITFISQSNKGPGPARNRGLDEAKGNFVAFLDADDYWREDCLELLHEKLVKSSAELSYCGWQNVGFKGGRGEPYIPPDYEKENKVEAFLKSCPWPIHAVLIKFSALKEVGGFDERWSTSMDYDLWLRLATFRKIVRVDEVLAFYRHYVGERVTGNRWKVARNHWLIQKEFVKNHRQQVKYLGRERLRQLIEGELLHRAYVCYWDRDLISARKIFRLAFGTGICGIKDLKYILPCYLPYRLHVALLKVIDKPEKDKTVEIS